MKYIIHIGSNPIELFHDNLDRSIDVDSLTTIDTSNLFGEHTTISAAVNRIGLLKSEVQRVMDETKLELKIFEGNFKANLRKQAAQNGGKFTLRVGNEDVEVKLTEAALSTSFENDKDWVELKKKYIQSERNWNALDVLFWSMQDKSRKLNNLIHGTTPEEYIEGLVEGKVNGILIKKK